MTVALWAALVALATVLLGWALSHRRAGRALSHEIGRREAAEAAMADRKLVSHELRTPLTAIKGFVELVAGGEAGPVNETQREFLEITARNAERLSVLVGQLAESETTRREEGDRT